LTPVRIGIVLAAGGSVGVAYHGAVLAAIEEVTGWDPRQAEVMVGTSAGSITSAILRAGVPAPDLVRFTENQDLSEEGASLTSVGRPHRPRIRLSHAAGFRPVADVRAVLHGVTRPGSHPARGLMAAALPRGGIPTEAISEGINAVFAGNWPERSLWICSVDLRSGRRVVFGRPGSPRAEVGSAVAASSAIPGYFKPVVIDGRRYVDGGVHSMVNLDVLGGSELDLVIVSSPLSQTTPVPALAADTVMRQPLRAQLRREIGALRRTGVPVVAVEPGRRVALAMGSNPMESRRRRQVSRVTYAAVSRWLTEGVTGRRLAEVLAGEAVAAGRRPPVSEQPFG
jgi:NTE family protein